MQIHELDGKVKGPRCKQQGSLLEEPTKQAYASDEVLGGQGSACRREFQKKEFIMTSMLRRNCRAVEVDVLGIWLNSGGTKRRINRY